MDFLGEGPEWGAILGDSSLFEPFDVPSDSVMLLQQKEVKVHPSASQSTSMRLLNSRGDETASVFAVMQQADFLLITFFLNNNV